MASRALPAVALIALLLALSGASAAAHQDGCHAHHSCPSDADPPTYMCGDTGHCSECPDNAYCLNGEPRPYVTATLTLNREIAEPGTLCK